MPERTARAKAFETAMQELNCASVFNVAEKAGAAVVWNEHLTLDVLPEPLRDAITRRGPNRASPLFGRGEDVRVLIACPQPHPAHAGATKAAN